tara:strand:- start:207 stop:1931 length:1725 start_codon:yes stop_codon:yes gene_type:complete
MININKNNLVNDPSPYLQQHKDNPVNWQVWSKKTFELAKEKKLPILLSVGYASCHWCHVMAHESFEDIETSKLMNELFINVKVDREERPDIDYVFQSSYQLFNQAGGGWPLTMFLDENGVPFSGGTYFPKVQQHGLPSFKEVLIKVSDVYKDQREKILKQANLVKESLSLKRNSVINQDLKPLVDETLLYLDPINGGYKGAPKFPTFNVFETLLYYYNKTKDKKYLIPIETLLKNLCSQGIYDHVEGGISRYTVDEKWLVPHFEKMLYDNVQFISLISSYLKIKNNSYFQNKLIHTINFLLDNFQNSEKLMGSAYDADSEGEEGKYYTFTYDELKDIKDINLYYEVNPSGNWEGKIILKELQDPNEEIRLKLINLRRKKIKPFFDDKSQLDLNCLWVSSLISSYQTLKVKRYLDLAETFFLNITKKYKDEKLYHSYSDSFVFLEDYAYYIKMLLDLADTTMAFEYKQKAQELCIIAIDKFYDKNKNIFQKNMLLNDDLFFNPVDIGDSTISNGNSIMLNNLVRLGLLDQAEKLSQSLFGYLNFYKRLMLSSLKSLDYFQEIKAGKNCSNDGCEI